MTRLSLAVCFLLTACSTALYPYAEEDLEPGNAPSTAADASAPRVDAGRPDGGFVLPGWDGGLLVGPLPDAGLLFPFDSGIVFPPPPPDASLPDDFEYSCDVYDVPVACPFSLSEGSTCRATGGECPSISGRGLISWLSCSGGVWRSVKESRCGWNCSTDLPYGLVTEIPTQNCRGRPAVSCEVPGRATSQQGVDDQIQDIGDQCGASGSAFAVRFNRDSCPSQLIDNDAQTAPAALQCILRRLSTLRFGCDIPCARAPGVKFPF